MNDLYFNCTASYNPWYFVDGSYKYKKQHKQSTPQRSPISKPVGSINNTYKHIQIYIMRAIKKNNNNNKKQNVYQVEPKRIPFHHNLPLIFTVSVINFPKFQITSTSSHFINLINLSSEVKYSKLTRNSDTLSINCFLASQNF